MGMFNKMTCFTTLLPSIPLINIYLSPFMESAARAIQIYMWHTKDTQVDTTTIINQVASKEIYSN